MQSNAWIKRNKSCINNIVYEYKDRHVYKQLDSHVVIVK